MRQERGVDVVHACERAESSPRVSEEHQEREPGGDGDDDGGGVARGPVIGPGGDFEGTRDDDGGERRHPRGPEIPGFTLRRGRRGVAEGDEGDEETPQGVPAGGREPPRGGAREIRAGEGGGFFVQSRMRERHRRDDVLVETRERHRREGRPQDVEGGDGGGGVYGLGAVRAEKPEPHVGHGVDEVFVEGVQHHLAITLRGPSPVDEEKPGEEPELTDGKIGREHGGATLPAAYSDADVRRLDHPDVVGAVAHAERDPTAALLHQRRHARLLYGTHPAAHHPRARRAQVRKVPLLVLAERVLQRAALDHQTEFGTERAVLRRLSRFPLEKPSVRAFADDVGFANHHQIAVRVHQRARVGDAHRGLELIPREHPHEHASLAERRDGLWDALLEFILHGGGAHQFAIAFDRLGDVGEAILAVHQRRRRRAVRRVPRRELGLGEVAARQHERAETLARERVKVFSNRANLRG